MNEWGRIVGATALAGLLAGCSLFRQDGWDDAPRTFDIPVRNYVNEAPPYEVVEGNPMPDKAWLRERASECEPWQVGQNGCAAPRIVDAVQPPAHAARPAPRRAPKRVLPHCTCPKGKTPGS